MIALLEWSIVPSPFHVSYSYLTLRASHLSPAGLTPIGENVNWTAPYMHIGDTSEEIFSVIDAVPFSFSFSSWGGALAHDLKFVKLKLKSGATVELNTDSVHNALNVHISYVLCMSIKDGMLFIPSFLTVCERKK